MRRRNFVLALAAVAASPVRLLKTSPRAMVKPIPAARAIRRYTSDSETKLPVSDGVGFKNSWQDFGVPYAPARYHFDKYGTVILSGAIKGGEVGLPAFTLPIGYRPEGVREFPVVSNGHYGIVRISPTGEVTPLVGSNYILSLDGVHWQGEP